MSSNIDLHNSVSSCFDFRKPMIVKETIDSLFKHIFAQKRCPHNYKVCTGVLPRILALDDPIDSFTDFFRTSNDENQQRLILVIEPSMKLERIPTLACDQSAVFGLTREMIDDFEFLDFKIESRAINLINNIEDPKDEASKTIPSRFFYCDLR